MTYATRIGVPVAAVAVIASLVLLLIGSRSTPVETAEAYLEARNAYDTERARELIAGDFRTVEPPDGFVDESGLELAFEMHRAHRFHYSDGECREGAASSRRTVVTCNYLWSTEMHRIAGHPPTPARFTFHISDGRIQRVDHSASNDFYFGPRNFYGFLSEHHPEFTTLVDDSFNLEPEATREVVERLPHYFELYEEWLSQQP